MKRALLNLKGVAKVGTLQINEISFIEIAD